MTDGLILGAYALEPAADAGEDWYGLLGDIEGASGLEIPLRGGALHPGGAGRLAPLLPEGWNVVVTMLPSAMAGLRASAGYGLASTDAEGRAAAIADVRRAFAEADALAQELGRQVVTALHLTSAPRGGGDEEQLAAALVELGADAGGIGLYLEHCDSWREDRPVQKGFLPIDQEIAAVLAARERTGADLGQVVNWGRSVIDERSVDGARAHLDVLLGAGTLRGLMLSGASASGGGLGEAWADAHNPVASVDPSSLLSEAEIARSLTPEVVATSHHLGVKVQDPARAEGLDARLEPLRRTVAAVRASLTEVAA
ncbi:MAG TPA: DUF4862 family protein [Gryllotalpicola sp.]